MKPKQKELLRERLLEQGIELIAEHGYHGTGLKKILDTVQVPKGSFYNYFDSKEAYVAEIIQKYSDNLLKQVDDYLHTTKDDPVTAIRVIIYKAIRKLKEEGLRGCLTGNLAAEIGASSKACQAAMKDSVQLWKSRFSKLFREGQKNGSFRDDLSAEMLTDIFWSIWQGGLLRIKIDSDTEHLKSMVDLTLDSLFKKLQQSDCDIS
jgi:TetR/AcrR family transcriptional repressor of nem operon